MNKYKVVQERAFDTHNLEGFKELLVMQEERHWIKLNILFQETNKLIGLDFYTNNINHQPQYYSSYVQGKFIYYSVNAINTLLDLRPTRLYGVRNRRDPNNKPTKERWKAMKDELCRPEKIGLVCMAFHKGSHQ